MRREILTDGRTSFSQLFSLSSNKYISEKPVVVNKDTQVWHGNDKVRKV
jgi:hypothetical protein